MRQKPDIKIFKFPERLAEAFEREPLPHVVGFSNYVWNSDLGTEIARVIKKKHPHIIIVMGGPNYPTDQDEQRSFLSQHQMIDFYIVKEGERAFGALVSALEDCDFDKNRVPLEMPSVHRLTSSGKFHAASTTDRLLDLSEIPSPYLEGKLDEYFDGVMLPIIQTNRGCPFRCTFCVEGDAYYSRVSKTHLDKVRSELEYIALRMAKLCDEHRGRSDLHIADSNFGMYREDIDVCEILADLQVRYQYPAYINVATGKNHKKRVLEAAKILNGALRLSGSVQSLDRDVLANIDRSNINVAEILDLALSASEIGANSYSEIILGLPGDTRTSHFNSIRTIVEADFNTVALYQLMLLPGTELATYRSIDKWKMKTAYRVLPRCFGYYDILGEKVNAAEIEQICIANDSLTAADYLDSRRMHLVVNLFYNDGIFKEVLRLIKAAGLSRYAWLELIWKERNDEGFDHFVSEFLQETEMELWADSEALRLFTRKRENVEKYISGMLGSNLIFKYKSLGFIEQVDTMARVAKSALSTLFTGIDKEQEYALGVELVEFGRLRAMNVFREQDAKVVGRFRFDVVNYSEALQPKEVSEYLLPEEEEYEFVLTPDQRQTLASYIGVYGESVTGLSRILSKVYVRRLLRIASRCAGPNTNDSTRDTNIVVGQATLSGLNQFG
jgi:radical SAM superfamily enzyme YgiQ (UPF0313 family)